MPRRPFQFLLLFALGVACAAPPRTTPVQGLEAPVPSPPASLDAAGRLSWWQDQLPQLGSADRAEARLLMGELQLELRHSSEARQAFYEALGAQLSTSEFARAERGIGLSYLLEDRESLARPHLEKALPHLDPQASGETRYLLTVLDGRPVPPELMVHAAQAQPWLPAGSTGIEIASAPRTTDGPIAVDLDRRAWKAAPMKANWDPMTTPYRITIHHTAEPFHGTSVADTIGQMQFLQRLHQVDKGWADLGYHYLIDPSGRLIEGRPMKAQGAHAYKKNNIGNIGICVIGNFVAQPQRGSEYARAQAPTAAQLATLERVVDELREVYGIVPRQVEGHQDLRSTACPGPRLESWVKAYQRRHLP